MSLYTMRFTTCKRVSAYSFDSFLPTHTTLLGVHSLDPDLLAVMELFSDRTYVLTRNAHTEDIRTFLAGT